MNTRVLTATPNPLTQLTYQVLIEQHDEELYSAMVWELPECRSSGSSKEEALKILHRLLIERLKRVEIVSLTVEIPQVQIRPIPPSQEGRHAPSTAPTKGGQEGAAKSPFLRGI